jgi:hypothetical protein
MAAIRPAARSPAAVKFLNLFITSPCKNHILDTYSHVLPGMQDDAIASFDVAFKRTIENL